MTTPATPKDSSFEAQLSRLQSVVERLETGDLTLAESVLLYEEGVAMGARCQQLLDTAEIRVQQLSIGGDGETLSPWTLDE
ncbi:MAG: hypothetical protein NVS4B8_27310 [Herpetosiphon sp.]